MSRYYRHNPDEPIRNDWTATERAHDEADCLRDWVRDAAAEAALALPGLESTGIETLRAEELPRSTGEAAQNQQSASLESSNSQQPQIQ